MKAVIMYTLNREAILVPEYQDYIENFRWLGTDDFVCDNGSLEPKEAKIGKEILPIIEIVNAVQFNRLELEPSNERTYIAVDPKLMEALSYKHEQELIAQYNNLSAVIDDVTKLCDEYSDRLIAFYKLPWYKRIYLAIKRDI